MSLSDTKAVFSSFFCNKGIIIQLLNKYVHTMITAVVLVVIDCVQYELVLWACPLRSTNSLLGVRNTSPVSSDVVFTYINDAHA